MEWVEAVAWVVKALGAGALSYVAQQILASAHKKLNELRSQPLGSNEQQDVEELLAHLIDEAGSPEDLTALRSIHVIRLQAGVTIAYVTMRVERLTASRDKGKPGGT